VYCYGAEDRCLKGSCSTDSDCSIFTDKSPKHNDLPDIGGCEGAAGWALKACQGTGYWWPKEPWWYPNGSRPTDAATASSGGTSGTTTGGNTALSSSGGGYTLLIGDVPDKEGDCLGWDSRCDAIGFTEEKCLLAAKLGADCVWYDRSGEEGICMGQDSRCQKAEKNYCFFHVSKNTGDPVHDADCEWFGKPQKETKGVCYGKDSRCAATALFYQHEEQWKMEIACKWQVHVGADCKWFHADTEGTCEGSNPRCAGLDVISCFETIGCQFVAAEQVDTSGLTLSPLLLRRLRTAPADAHHRGVQLAAKHGIAAGYENVEPYEVTITHKEMQGQDMKFTYEVAVLGSTVPSNITDQQRISVINTKLEDQSLGLKFGSAKFEAVTSKKRTLTFAANATTDEQHSGAVQQQLLPITAMVAIFVLKIPGALQ